MFGYSHFTGGFAGGQAEYVRVPFGDVNLLKLPANVPDEQGLYLSDVVCTSWHCVVDTGVEKGDVVAIWGAGKLIHRRMRKQKLKFNQDPLVKCALISLFTMVQAESS